MSYTFSSNPTTDIYRVHYKTQSGRLMEEVVRVPAGQGGLIKDMTESKYGPGSYLGCSTIGSE